MVRQSRALYRKSPKSRSSPSLSNPMFPRKNLRNASASLYLQAAECSCLTLTNCRRKKEKYREKLKAKRLAGSKKKPEDKNKRNLKWCFGCRARGHTLENCPKVQAAVCPRAQSNEQQEGGNVLLCFNCGSKGALVPPVQL